MDSSVIARILPYILFGLVLSLKEPLFPDPLWGSLVSYAVPAAALLYFRKSYTELSSPRLSRREAMLGMAVGVVGIILWIAPYHFFPDFHRTDGVFGLLGGQRASIQPDDFSSSGEWVAYFIIRSLGYVAITPLFEEIFVRSFMFRYLINSPFTAVPFGACTHLAFWGSSAFFALTHSEWIVAFFYSVLLNLLLVRSKSFSSCVVAHATSNLVLILFVAFSGQWVLW